MNVFYCWVTEGNWYFRRRCAWGTHPFPSRTRRLRPKRPMVLHWRRCGRVGGCRIPLKKNREKFYYNKTGIDIQNPVTPERSYEIPFELKRSVPTHISREVLLHITGFTSDQKIEQKFSFLMTDKASVKSSAEAEWTCTLKTAYTK